MAELDLKNPSQLAELLRASLPGLNDETPERVAPLIEALEQSDNDVFAMLGKGTRGGPQVDPIQQQPPIQPLPPKEEPAPVQQLPPKEEPAPVQQQAPKPKPKQKKGKKSKEGAPKEIEQPKPVEQQDPVEQIKEMAPVPKHRDAQQGPAEPLPLDMGGEGILLDDVPESPSSEYGHVPIYARRGWTEIDRVRSKGKHPIYKLAASHHRHKPITAKFMGNCQSVRVSLPYAKPDGDSFIGTWIGPVEAKDHLIFSVEEAIAHYSQAFGRRPPLSRVDLITGARFRGRRFSPISIYLGYESTAADAKPTLYMLEGGSAGGKPEAMYVARSIDSDITTQSNFKFTPFSCHANWYEGGLAMNDARSEPICVYLSAALNREGRNEYLKLSVEYELDRDPDRVVHPFELQVEAAMRVLAIADESGCKLKVGTGGVLQHSLGPVARALIPWEERPNGTTTSQDRDMFCGCPKP
jgi:hypothetical protein